MKNQPKKLAVFDIDGTIFRSSLLIQLSHALVESKIFPKHAEKEIEKEFLAWVDRKGTYEAYINKVVQIYIEHIKGKGFDEVDKVARSVIAYQKDRVYRYTRDLIKKLKKQKYFLVAISGSPSYIVEVYAKAIGFDLFFGTELEIKNGKFTGKVLSIDSAINKSKIMKTLSKDYPSLNFKDSVAVGDTESDIEMLSLVGKPIAFNPNFKLTEAARKRKWDIIVERKDVIYRVKYFDFVK